MMIDRDYDWTGGLIFFIGISFRGERRKILNCRSKQGSYYSSSNAAHLTELFNHRCLYRVYQ